MRNIRYVVMDSIRKEWLNVMDVMTADVSQETRILIGFNEMWGQWRQGFRKSWWEEMRVLCGFDVTDDERIFI